jgi:hypothetical protein
MNSNAGTAEDAIDRNGSLPKRCKLPVPRDAGDPGALGAKSLRFLIKSFGVVNGLGDLRVVGIAFQQRRLITINRITFGPYCCTRDFLCTRLAIRLLAREVGALQVPVQHCGGILRQGCYELIKVLIIVGKSRRQHSASHEKQRENSVLHRQSPHQSSSAPVYGRLVYGRPGANARRSPKLTSLMPGLRLKDATETKLARPEQCLRTMLDKALVTTVGDT